MMTANGRPPLATVLKRFAAILLDGLLFSLASIPMGIGYAGVIYLGITGDTGSLMTGCVFLLLLGALLVQSYSAYVLARWAYGDTPGKKMLGLKVVRVDTGEPVGFWRMALRQIIGQWLSAIICYLGFLWAFFDANRQTWHDKLAKTLVVQTR